MLSQSRAIISHLWPDVQCLPHWCTGVAVKSQIEATWRPKNNAPPFSAYVHQRIPRVYPWVIHAEIKYSQESNVGELGYIAPVK